MRTQRRRYLIEARSVSGIRSASLIILGLRRFVEHRIADERILRLIDKWLAAGVVEDGQWSACEEGSPQGASVSPLLANVYLHVCHECEREVECR